jgi:hypothetical protein
MAFIRWRLNSAGKRQAYLVHSYRDQAGKPRHRVLAYLGNNAELTPEHLAELQAKHADLKVNWDRIKPPPPRPLTDLSSLSDAGLLQKMRILRHERGIQQFQMAGRLRDAGIPNFSGVRHSHFHHGHMGDLEKAMEQGDRSEFYLDPEAELAPYLRKALES